MTSDKPKTPFNLKAWLANGDDAPVDWAERRKRRLKYAEDEVPESYDPDGPTLFIINSKDWWFKIVGMLCHNWALIEETATGATVYFFHDLGRPRGLNYNNRSAIIDSLDFNSVDDAETALCRNGFDRLEPNPGEWDGYVPPGNFYDARLTEPGIYSKGEYWED